MKKWLMIPLILILATLLVLGILFLRVFFLSDSTEETVEKQPLLPYAQEHLTDYTLSYDEETQVLTLSRMAPMTYAQACEHGGSIYTDELAPESYLPSVQSIAADLRVNCDAPGLVVVLSYESNDGREIFHVASNGEIETCWERET